VNASPSSWGPPISTPRGSPAIAFVCDAKHSNSISFSCYCTPNFFSRISTPPMLLAPPRAVGPPPVCLNLPHGLFALSRPLSCCQIHYGSRWPPLGCWPELGPPEVLTLAPWPVWLNPPPAFNQPASYLHSAHRFQHFPLIFKNCYLIAPAVSFKETERIINVFGCISVFFFSKII